ncbi:WD repeat-containing protein 43 [Odontomachus brunneus]|uniref:WD repeat-containing protein 43 n=1 Tax=Odontomachus brunneus TaxID=486640 RepID=UPI0013F1FEE5|nr:WD repeat-containing protein 43 [Odontomachus brunneus]
MAVVGTRLFSPDGQYYAFCGVNGSLKIWDTATSRFKHEHTHNQHLATPCGVLEWMSVSSQSAEHTWQLPRKRRRRKSNSEDADHKIVAIGTSVGEIALYNLSSTHTTTLKNDGGVACTALTWSARTGLIAALDDCHLVQWNGQPNGIKCKWKSDDEKVTALAVLEDGKSLLTAGQYGAVKWWDLATKQLIRAFTGHTHQVTFLRPVKIDHETNYLVSSACMENYLGIWLLDKHKNDKTATVWLCKKGETTSISTLVTENSQIVVLATTDLGKALLYKYQPNGRTKPLQPTLSIEIVLDVKQKEVTQKIPIVAGHLTDDEKVLLVYDNDISLTFEKIVPDFSNKEQRLIRTGVRNPKEKTQIESSKVMPTREDENVKYYGSGTGVSATKRVRTMSGGSQLLLKDRLENLSLNADANTPGRSPTKGANMAQLLIQGLNSKDKNILTTVLFTKNETMIRNTVAKLPAQAIIPLLKELIVMLQGKTYACKVAVKWLQILITNYGAHLLSRSDRAQMLSPFLSFIDDKLNLFTQVQRLKGRVSLVTGLISQTNEEHDKYITQEALLVYRDQDSSDEALDVDDVNSSSESDDNWEEMSQQNEENEQDEEDIKNIESDNDHSADDSADNNDDNDDNVDEEEDDNAMST